MNLTERAESYHEAFPKWPPVFAAGGYLLGTWMIGNCYRNHSRYYGAYPHGYLDRVHALFPDAENVLHLFSGSVQKGRWPRERTLDADASLKPDLARDVDVGGWTEGLAGFDLVLADPPYTEEDAAHYGRPLVKRNKVIAACVDLLKPGGHMVWLDQIFPIYRKVGLKLVGTIGLLRSTNHRVRCVFIWERLAEPVTAPPTPRRAGRGPPPR